MNFTISPDKALLFGNAFELIVQLAVLLAFARVFLREIEGPADFWRRTRRAVNPDFQGEAYDLAVAVAAMVFGEFIRRIAIWYWRSSGGDFPFLAYTIAIAFIAVGALCVIRVMAPTKHYNLVWIGVLTAALGFAVWSVR